MAVILDVPMPINDVIARPRRPGYAAGQDSLEGKITQTWAQFLQQQGLAIQAAPQRIQSVTLTTQAASVPATDISAGLSAGFYRVTWYAQITQAATVNSSLTVTIEWTNQGVTPSFSGAAIVGNTLTTVQSETFSMLISGNSPIRYSTAYVSVGATPMQYELQFALESLAL